MPCSYSSTAPAQGDDIVALLKKIVQSLGESWDCLDREWQLTAAILTHYGGVPAQGDSIPKLWQKIRIVLGDESCRCGDSAWDSIRRVLDILSPTTPGDANDSVYRLLWKLLEALQTPDPTIPQYITSLGTGFAAATQSPTVDYPATQEGDLMIVAFSTNSLHNATGTPPAGWTLLDELDDTLGDGSGTLFWKRASASEPANEVWTNIFDTTEIGVAVVSTYRGVISSGDFWDVKTKLWSSLKFPHSIGPVVTTERGCLMVCMITCDPQTALQLFTFNNMDTRINYTGASAIAQVTVGDADQMEPASVTITGSFASAAEQCCMFLYAIKPVPV